MDHAWLRAGTHFVTLVEDAQEGIAAWNVDW